MNTTKKHDGETEDNINIDTPPRPCPHPEHRLGTNGGIRPHQRVCLQCGAVVLVKKRKTP